MNFFPFIGLFLTTTLCSQEFTPRNRNQDCTKALSTWVYTRKLHKTILSPDVRKILIQYITPKEPYCEKIENSKSRLPQKSESTWKSGHVDGLISVKNQQCLEKHAVSIRAWHHYTAENADKISLTILIHGTGAYQAGWYRQKGHEQFEKFLSAAKNDADITQSAVDVISFGWSGQNTTTSRHQAATALGTLINTVAQRYEKITLIGHSHGGNIALAASHHTETPLILILMATPIRSDNKEIDALEDNFSPSASVKELYNLYSTGDFLQSGGSIRAGLSAKGFYKMAQSIMTPGSSRKISMNNPKIHAHNIEVFIDNRPPSHGNIRNAITHVAEIIRTIKTDSSNAENSDFDAHISTSAQSCTLSPHVSGSDLSTQDWVIRKSWRIASTLWATKDTLIQSAMPRKPKTGIEKSPTDCTKSVSTIA